MVFLDANKALGYTSNSQKARVMTEFWTGENVFCPACGDSIFHYDNNKPVADFYCKDCKEDYELKSGTVLGNKITDGAYSTMISRLQSDNNPNFFFLNYKKSYEIQNFVVIPKHYFTPEIIEKRKPLPETARRAGWTGCNILLSPIPESGKIFYIQNGIEQDKKVILHNWNKTLFLREKKSTESKGWILDIMKCIEMIPSKEFSLQQMYDFEPILKQKYPDNNHIKDKIRQQLQFLRDKGYLEFVGSGKYRVL